MLFTIINSKKARIVSFKIPVLEAEIHETTQSYFESFRFHFAFTAQNSMTEGENSCACEFALLLLISSIIFELFFCKKKIPLSRCVRYVMDGSMDE